MTYETIQFEVKDQVAIITLNRPEAANGLINDLGQGTDACGHPLRRGPGHPCGPAHRARQIFQRRRRSEVFCGIRRGLAQALKEMTVILPRGGFALHAHGQTAGDGRQRARSGDGDELCHFRGPGACRRIGVIHGGLHGGGALAGRRDDIPAARFIGLLRTKELMLTNRRLTAKEALEWGLVNRVIPTRS